MSTLPRSSHAVAGRSDEFERRLLLAQIFERCDPVLFGHVGADAEHEPVVMRIYAQCAQLRVRLTEARASHARHMRVGNGR
jgi:hypothetical protein